jgi:hypothetical protein
MLTIITNPTHQLLQFIKDDPVRPDIPAEFRVSNGRAVVALAQEDKPSAMVCVSFHDFVPESVQDLEKVTEVPTTAVFYTIWSYKPGAGRELLVQAVEDIKKSHPSVKRFVTLSPKTEMAKRFHLKNGASIFRENSDTVNYEYSVSL